MWPFHWQKGHSPNLAGVAHLQMLYSLTQEINFLSKFMNSKWHHKFAKHNMMPQQPFQCINLLLTGQPGWQSPMLDRPPNASQCPVPHGLASHFIVPIINGLASHFQYSLCMDWQVSTVPTLAGSLIITPITYGVAGHVLFLLYTNWLVN